MSSTSDINTSWLVGAAFMCLVGGYLGNGLQSLGAKLAAPAHTFAHAFLSSPTEVGELDYLSTWSLTKLTDLALGAIYWFVVAYALALGKGDETHFAGTSMFSMTNLRDSAGGYAIVFYTFCLAMNAVSILSECVADYSSFAVQSMQLTYRVLSFVYCLAVFPIIFHWAWSDDGWASPFRSGNQDYLLAGCGVMDAAGSSVIHLSAGAASAAIIALLTPIKRRISSSTTKLSDEATYTSISATPMSSRPSDSNLRKSAGTGSSSGGSSGAFGSSNSTSNVGALMHCLGTLLVLAGSYAPHAINNLLVNTNTAAGSKFRGSSYVTAGAIDSGASAGKRVAMTTVAAACACVTAMVIITVSASVKEKRFTLGLNNTVSASSSRGKSGTGTSANACITVGRATLTSIAAISACCASCEFEGAFTIGVIAALLNWAVCLLLDALGIEDPAGGISIHLTGGAWGLFAAGLLTSRQGYKSTIASAYTTAAGKIISDARSINCNGVFYGGQGKLLGANITFILAVLAWSFGVIFVVGLALRFVSPSEFQASADAVALSNAKHARLGAGAGVGGERRDREARAEVTGHVSLAAIAAAENSSPSKVHPDIKSEPAKSTSSTVTFAADTKMPTPTPSIAEKPPQNLLSKFTNVANAPPVKDDKHELNSLKLDDKAFSAKYGYGWDVAIVFQAKKVKVDGAMVVKDVITYTKGIDHFLKDADGHEVSVRRFDPRTGAMKEEKKKIKPVAEIICAIRAAGLETRQFFSHDKEHIICKIRAPLPVLKLRADLTDIKMPLDAERLEEVALTGWQKEEIVGDKTRVTKLLPLKIADGIDMHLTTLRPFVFIYSSYNEEADAGGDDIPPPEAGAGNPDSASHVHAHTHAHDDVLSDDGIDSDWPALFRVSSGLRHGFGSILRIRIIYQILCNTGEFGCNLNLNKLQEELTGRAKISTSAPPGPYTKYKQIAGIFALHDYDVVERLRQEWLSWDVMPWSGPRDEISETVVDRVKDYLGEKIALYFTFLNHYATYLLTVSITGVVVVIHLIILASTYNNLDRALTELYSLPIYCALMACWSQWLLETWSCKERLTALRWGTIGYEETEGDRLDYKGVKTNSHIDGKETKIFDRVQKRFRLRLSRSLLIMAACVVVGVFSATFYLKFWLALHNLKNYTTFADIINAVSIIIVDALFKQFAVAMTNYENCRTETEYEDSIIAKLFLFGFFNSYCPSIYIGFIKQWIGDPCLYGSCIAELGQTMLIIFTSRLVVSALTKILIPLLVEWYHIRRERAARDKDSKTLTEEQFLLPVYDDVFDDYNELSVQFGYIVLFGPAFPLAPLLAFISNYSEIRADGYKILVQNRRAWPLPAEDIGTWSSIFEAVSVLSVFSNAALIFYTMDIFDFLGQTTKLGLFIVFIVICFSLRAFFESFADAYPERIDIQLRRQEYLVTKLVKREPDEDVAADLLRMQKAKAKSLRKEKTAIPIEPTDERERAAKDKLLGIRRSAKTRGNGASSKAPASTAPVTATTAPAAALATAGGGALAGGGAVASSAMTADKKAAVEAGAMTGTIAGGGVASTIPTGK